MSESNMSESMIDIIPNFPKPGIDFKDLTRYLRDAPQDIFTKVVNAAKDFDFDKILAIESRGFIFGAALSNATTKPLILARKQGKLPKATFHIPYGMEYGDRVLEIHQEDLSQGERVLIVDDVLATGGTAMAAAQLANQAGATVVGALFVLEIKGLGGVAKLQDEVWNCPVKIVL